MNGTVVCPVCTLYLRPGMTLKSHLESHPKQKVIEALIKLHADPTSATSAPEAPPPPPPQPEFSTVIQPNLAPPPQPTTQQWGTQMPPSTTYIPAAPKMGGPSMVPTFIAPTPTPFQGQQQPAGAAGNHTFFYQQIIGSSSQPQGGYLIPVFNQQLQGCGGMMPAPGYMYQQQMFVSSGGAGAGIGGGSPMRMLIPAAGGEAQISEPSELSAIEHKMPEIDEIDEGPTEIQEPDEPKLLLNKENKDMMPQLEITAVVEMADVGGESLILSDAGETHDDPPQLSPETLDVDMTEDKTKYKNAESPPPQYVTLGTLNHSLDTSGDHHFEMDGMNLVLVNSYNRMNNVGISDDAADFDHAQHSVHENISIDSANIRADENMPQESNSNASWTRPQYHESSSRMSAGMSTYDLLARETWEGSDDDVDAPPPYQSHFPLYNQHGVEIDNDDDDDVMISSTSRQGIEYKCSSCSMTFICPKERRVHQAAVHENHHQPHCSPPQVTTTSAGLSTAKEIPDIQEERPPVDVNIIGSGLYKKKVKKLVIKPKKLKAEKVVPSFDQIFTNIMKVEDERIASEVDAVDPLRIVDGSNKNILISKQEIASSMASSSEGMPKDDVTVSVTVPPAICVICCTVVRDPIALRKHQVELHAFREDTKYKCGVCQEHYTNEAQFNAHLVDHPLECLFCGKYFYRSHNLQLHVKRHMGIRPYRCPTCDKSFLTRQKLQEHQHMHTGESPIKCNLCEETFKRYSNLIQHRNRRHLNIKRKLKDFICALCGDVYHSKKKLAWHKEVHENRPKSCQHCSEKFVHMSSLTRHVRRAHNERFVPTVERDHENVECHICKGIFLKSSLDTHIKSHDKKQFSCSVCEKEFSTKWNLKLHQWTHAGRAQKPFKCELCKGAFVREADYTAHMNSHRAIRPYTCNHCGAQFIRKYNCQRHVKEHEKTKTFNCNICGKKFHRSYYLNDHMRIHSGARPFSCHICGKTSTTKSNHNKHVRIHHAREPVSTEN